MAGALKVVLLGEGAGEVETALRTAGAEVVAPDGDVALAVGLDGVAALAQAGAPRLARLALDASAADALDVPVIAATSWAADLIGALRPELWVRLVRPGPARAAVATPAGGGPLRVQVVEGAAALAEMAEPHEVVAAGADVLLDLSRAPRLVEPALVAGLGGAAAVVTGAPGREEVVRHGEDGMVVGWDDPRGSARTLDLLARDRDLLRRLQHGARARSEAWPSAVDFGRALLATLRELPPPGDDLARQAAAMERAQRAAQTAATAAVAPGAPASGVGRRPRARRVAEALRRVAR